MTNIVRGDWVAWDEPQFSGGSFYRGKARGVKCVGTIRRSGVVIKDSYGEKTGQHTFTVQLDDGGTKRVMGRNLYGKLVEHRPGDNHESNAAEKAALIELARLTEERVPARFRGSLS